MSWFYFALPCSPPVTSSTVRVRAESEAEARDALRRNSYRGAPVDAWPLLGIERCLTAQCCQQRVTTPHA